MDGMNFAWWPPNLRNVTLQSSKNNNLASMYILSFKNSNQFYSTTFSIIVFNTLKDIEQITNIICCFQNEYFHMMKRVFCLVPTKWKL